jgi:hypothetical protein
MNEKALHLKYPVIDEIPVGFLNNEKTRKEFLGIRSFYLLTLYVFRRWVIVRKIARVS